jgi:hypothetical protein
MNRINLCKMLIMSLVFLLFSAARAEMLVSEESYAANIPVLPDGLPTERSLVVSIRLEKSRLSADSKVWKCKSRKLIQTAEESINNETIVTGSETEIRVALEKMSEESYLNPGDEAMLSMAGFGGAMGTGLMAGAASNPVGWLVLGAGAVVLTGHASMQAGVEGQLIDGLKKCGVRLKPYTESQREEQKIACAFVIYGFDPMHRTIKEKFDRYLQGLRADLD